MRFSKILLVCFALLLFAGLSAHQACTTGAAGTLIRPVVVESAAGSAVLSASFIADGGAPLPPPIAADGGAPLPPPTVADGGAPLPPPSGASVMLGIRA
jgi:hypothetical protein